jgi:predicted RNase H-like HicB family nuclease
VVTITRTDIPVTAEIHRDGKWFVAFCPEFPEANGQGETEEECVRSLRDAIMLLLEDRREDARMKAAPDTAFVALA